VGYVGLWKRQPRYPPRLRPYTLEGYPPQITCPTLVLDGENDPGRASQLYETLRCKKTYHNFPAAEGAVNTARRGDVQAAPSGL